MDTSAYTILCHLRGSDVETGRPRATYYRRDTDLFKRLHNRSTLTVKVCSNFHHGLQCIGHHYISVLKIQQSHTRSTQDDRLHEDHVQHRNNIPWALEQ